MSDTSPNDPDLPTFLTSRSVKEVSVDIGGDSKNDRSMLEERDELSHRSSLSSRLAVLFVGCCILSSFVVLSFWNFEGVQNSNRNEETVDEHTNAADSEKVRGPTESPTQDTSEPTSAEQATGEPPIVAADIKIVFADVYKDGGTHGARLRYPGGKELEFCVSTGDPYPDVEPKRLYIGATHWSDFRAWLVPLGSDMELRVIRDLETALAPYVTEEAKRIREKVPRDDLLGWSGRIACAEDLLDRLYQATGRTPRQAGVLEPNRRETHSVKAVQSDVVTLTVVSLEGRGALVVSVYVNGDVQGVMTPFPEPFRFKADEKTTKKVWENVHQFLNNNDSRSFSTKEDLVQKCWTEIEIRRGGKIHTIALGKDVKGKSAPKELMEIQNGIFGLRKW